MQAPNYAATLIAIQIAFLGWRINREIQLGDDGRRTWFPVSDYLNIISMILVVWFCIILPINELGLEQSARLVISVGFCLIVMHPINIVGHYRILSPIGRTKYISEGKDYPYITDHEWITLGLTGLAVVCVFNLWRG